jgi:hypothetical protein
MVCAWNHEQVDNFVANRLVVISATQFDVCVVSLLQLELATVIRLSLRDRLGGNGAPGIRHVAPSNNK